MGRWLLLSSGLLALGAWVSLDPSRAADARPLGGRCESTHDCQSGTHCIDDGALAGQCSTACTAADHCQQLFDNRTICLGADLCARACAVATECPTETHCNAYGWCELD